MSELRMASATVGSRVLWTIYSAHDLSHRIVMNDAWIQDQIRDIRERAKEGGGCRVLYDEDGMFMFMEPQYGDNPVSYVRQK
jgi:hypothetical protein